MKIYIVGELEDAPDEAMKKTAQKYASELRKNHIVRGSSPHDLLSTDTLLEIKRFDPDILHFVPGPSIFSLLLTKTISEIVPRTKIVHSALHPGFHPLTYGWYYGISYHLKPILPLVRPDLMLTQSDSTKEMFEQYGLSCVNIFGGVDTHTYQPVSENRKSQLRAKYSLPTDDYLCLHVGSIREWRNLQVLTAIPDSNTTLLIVGSSATDTESDVETKLRRNNAIIIDEYINDIHEVYALSDCYVFPTTEEVGCCEIPLSILEAMSCNLPIITTPFGGIKDMLPVKNRTDIQLATNSNSFTNQVEVVRDSESTTRELAIKHDWSRVTHRIEEEYAKLIS